MGPNHKGGAGGSSKHQEKLVNRFRFHDTEVTLPHNGSSDLQFVDGELHIELTRFSGSIILKPGKMSNLPASASPMAPPTILAPLTLDAITPSSESSAVPTKMAVLEKEKQHDAVVKSPLPSTSVMTPSTTAQQSSMSSSKAKLKGTNKRGAQTYSPRGAEKENLRQGHGPGDSNKKIRSTPPGLSPTPPGSPSLDMTAAAVKPQGEREGEPALSKAEDIEGLEELELELSSQDHPLHPDQATDPDPGKVLASCVSLEAPAVKVEGILPPGRWGHTATLVGGDKMFVIGGQGDDEDGSDVTFGDIYIYLHKEGKWEKPLNCECPPRAWHSTTYIPDKNLLFIFGGERALGKEGEPPEVTGEILLFDTEILLFYPPAISGKQPSPRSGHSSSLVGRDVLIFGGSRGRKWLSTVSVLNIDRWQWRVPTIKGDAPKGRSYHSATVIDNDVVFFGGNDGNASFNDVIVLKCSADSVWEWFRPEVVGCPPSKRTGHAACLLADNRTILIHGGWDPQSESHEATQQFQDSFFLDTKSWEWLPGPQGALANLGHRVGHSSVLLPGPTHTVLLFGGQDAIGKRAQDLHALQVDGQTTS